jgi:hypothetical protein
MRSAKETAKLIRNLNLNIDTNTRIDAEILSELFEAQEKSKTTKPAATGPNIWRIIMKSRITKLAAAAGIIVAVLIGVSEFGGSIDGAGIAFGQIKQAVEKALWIHSVNNNSGSSDEGWLSFAQQIEINKKANGKITYKDYGKKIKYVYSPETEIITLTDISHEKFALGTTDIFSFIEAYLDKERARGAILNRKNGIYNEMPVEIWEVTRSEGNWSEQIKLFIDMENFLPLAVEVKSGDSNNESGYVGNITFDYPQNGPLDIYALGVPQSAKIIDTLPQQDVREILQTYQKCRSDSPSRFAAVQITNYEQAVMVEEGVFGIASIIYKDGQKQYGEHYELFATSDKYTAQMGDTFDSVQAWCRESDLAEIDEIDLYTGVYHYQTHYNSDKDKWDCQPREDYPDHLGSPLDILQQFGWTKGLYAKAKNSPPYQTQIIENQHSQENGLICIEELRQGAKYGDRIKVMPPIRNLYYLNPQRNYICERHEHYRRRNAPWQIDKAWLDGADPNDIRIDVTSIKQVTGYGQADSGQWYPKVVSENIISVRGEFLITHTIYLQMDAEFPEGIFDPDNLPK